MAEPGDKVTPAEEDSNPDNFESAIGPVDTASPSSAPSYRADDAEFINYVISNWYVSNTGVFECNIVRRTLKEFVEEQYNDHACALVSDVGHGVNESTTTYVPPTIGTEKFYALQSTDSVPAAGEDAKPLDENTCPVDEEFVIDGMTPKEFYEKQLNGSLKSTDLPTADDEDAEFFDEVMALLREASWDSTSEDEESILEGLMSRQFIKKRCNGSLNSTDSATAAGEDSDSD